jgi:D-alanyl-D-alanine carboxypeptidase (penicillin-binding protein 5/6)
VHLLSVVLGDPSTAARDADTLALLREGLRRYHRVSIAVAGRTYATVAANGDSREPVALFAARSASLVVSRAVAFHVSLEGVPTTLHGPLAAGSEVGEIDATENGRTVLAVPLVTRLAVAAAPASSDTRYWIGALALIILGGCTLRVMRSRARQRARRRRRRVLE